MLLELCLRLPACGWPYQNFVFCISLVTFEKFFCSPWTILSRRQKCLVFYSVFVDLDIRCTDVFTHFNVMYSSFLTGFEEWILMHSVLTVVFSVYWHWAYLLSVQPNTVFYLLISRFLFLKEKDSLSVI